MEAGLYAPCRGTRGKAQFVRYVRGRKARHKIRPAGDGFRLAPSILGVLLFSPHVGGIGRQLPAGLPPGICPSSIRVRAAILHQDLPLYHHQLHIVAVCIVHDGGHRVLIHGHQVGGSQDNMTRSASFPASREPIRSPRPRRRQPQWWICAMLWLRSCPGWYSPIAGPQ